MSTKTEDPALAAIKQLNDDVEATLDIARHEQKEARELVNETRIAVDGVVATSRDLSRRMGDLEARERLPGIATHGEPDMSRGVIPKGGSMLAWMRTHGASIGANPRFDDLSFGALLRAMARGPRNEIERAALGESSDSIGGVTVPALTLARFIDRMRARSVCFQAGAQVVPLQTDKTSIARVTGDASVAWHTEGATITGTDPVFDRVQFDAQTLCIGPVNVSVELLEDSINMEQVLEQTFAKAAAVELDRACLMGSGTPPEPKGVFNVTGINSVSMGTNGAALANYDPVLSAIQANEEDNAAPATALVMAPRTGKQFAALKEATTNASLAPPPKLVPIPFLTTTSIPINQVQGTSGAVCSSIIIGDFTELFVGMRTEFRLLVARESSRLASNLEVQFIGYLRADVQVAHGESFAKIIGIL